MGRYRDQMLAQRGSPLPPPTPGTEGQVADWTVVQPERPAVNPPVRAAMRRPAPFLLPGSVVDDSAHLPGGLTEGGKNIVCGLCHRDTGIWLTLARTVIDKHSKGQRALRNTAFVAGSLIAFGVRNRKQAEVEYLVIECLHCGAQQLPNLDERQRWSRWSDAERKELRKAWNF